MFLHTPRLLLPSHTQQTILLRHVPAPSKAPEYPAAPASSKAPGYPVAPESSKAPSHPAVPEASKEPSYPAYPAVPEASKAASSSSSPGYPSYPIASEYPKKPVEPVEVTSTIRVTLTKVPAYTPAPYPTAGGASYSPVAPAKNATSAYAPMPTGTGKPAMPSSYVPSEFEGAANRAGVGLMMLVGVVGAVLVL
ncbi:hypothetical protein Ptr902_10869 [Pyrenophora tritici-repentis]|nr:hypothetical protein Ptr902_10869 [Pyrenophora tritici-repentis]